MPTPSGPPFGVFAFVLGTATQRFHGSCGPIKDEMSVTNSRVSKTIHVEEMLEAVCGDLFNHLGMATNGGYFPTDDTLLSAFLASYSSSHLTQA
jgi:hypothetical protein